ncbi:MAG: FtsB family cell division protein [Gaiellaceae bacterium]
MAARDSRRPPRRPPKRKTRRIRRPAHALRLIGLVVLLVVAVGYVQPIRAYRDASANVAERKAEVARLASGNTRLEQRIAETETPEFVAREARKLGLVRPGERLFIVTGIEEWKQERRAREKARLR